jgi:O-antigen/teichoic acid export membrane protein
MKKKLIKNTLINYTSQFLSVVINLYLVAFMVRHLGGERYGLYVLVLSLVSYADLFRYGLGSSVIKYIAEYNASKNNSKANELVSVSLLFFFIQGAVTAIILSVIIIFFIDSIFNIPVTDLLQIKVLGIILLVYLFIDLLFATFSKIIEGLQRYDLLRITEILKKVLLAVFITWIIAFDYRFEFIGVAYLLSSLISGVVTIILSNRCHKYDIGLSNVNKAMCRQVLRFAWPQFLGKLTGFFGNRIDVLLIGIFLQPSFIAIYQIVYQFYQFITTVLGLLGSALFPYVSELHSKNESATIRRLYLTGTRYSMFISIPLVTGALFLVKPFLASWVGQEYGNYAYLAQIYLIPAILLASAALAGQISIGLDIIRYTIKYHVIGTSINFLVSLILIQKIGIAGVMIGTAVGSLIVWYPSNRIVLKRLGVRWKDFSFLLFLRPAIAVVIAAPALFLLKAVTFPKNMFLVLLYGCIYAAFFAVSFFYIGFGRIEREEIVGFAKQTLLNRT